MVRMMCSCLLGAGRAPSSSSTGYQELVYRRWRGVDKMRIAQLPAGRLQQHSGTGGRGCLTQELAAAAGIFAAGSLLALCAEGSVSGAEGVSIKELKLELNHRQQHGWRHGLLRPHC